jgi:hypothetical protein
VPCLLAALQQRRVHRLLRTDGIGGAVEAGLVADGTDLHGAGQRASVVELDAIDAAHAVGNGRHRQRTGQRFAVRACTDAAAGFLRMDLVQGLLVQRVMRVVFAGERIGLDGIDDGQGCPARDTIDVQAVFALESPDGVVGVVAEVAVDRERIAVEIPVAEAGEDLLEVVDTGVVVAQLECKTVCWGVVPGVLGVGIFCSMVRGRCNYTLIFMSNTILSGYRAPSILR